MTLHSVATPINTTNKPTRDGSAEPLGMKSSRDKQVD